MRLSRSTSATSPSRDAPSSIAQRPRSASAFASASISTARPPSKRMRSPVMERAGDVERLRRGDDAFGPSRVGRRVDLLGRDVRHVAHARARLGRAAFLREARAGEEADAEVGARALEAERVELERVETASRPGRSARSLVPGRAGSGSSRRQTWAMSRHSARRPRRRRARDRPSAPSGASGRGRASTRSSGRRSS